MTTTHPSSTPITAEGAVKTLRAALQKMADCALTVVGANNTTEALNAVRALNSAATNARRALAATDPAAIQQAGEALTDADIDTIWQTMQGGPAGWLKSFGYQQFAREIEAAILDGRAPQDAKAEQVEKCRLRLCCRADSHATGCNTYDPNRYPETRTPNGSIGEDAEFSRRLDNLIDARVDHDHDRITSSWIMLCEYLDTSTARQSAPIEAGELPPLPDWLEFIEDDIAYTADQMRACGQLCRDTERVSAAHWKALYDSVVELLAASKSREQRIERLGIATKPASTAPVKGKASDAEDAARYRWLREPSTDIGNVIDKEFAPGKWEYRAGEELDAAIDAARAQQQGGSDA